MSDGSGRPPRNTLRSVFERTAPREPLTTVEVAEALDTSRRTTYNWLTALADRGVLETKTVGASGRVWWMPTTEERPSKAETSPRIELTSDEVIEVAFESKRLARPFFELGDEDVRIVIEGYVRFADGSHVQYWTADGLSLDTLLRLPEHFPTNEDVRFLSKEGETYRVEVKGRQSSLISTYDDFEERPSQRFSKANRSFRRYGFPRRSAPRRYWQQSETPCRRISNSSHRDSCTRHTCSGTSSKTNSPSVSGRHFNSRITPGTSPLRGRVPATTSPDGWA